MNPTHPKWRALRLVDEKSIEYLNRMFRQGWYIVPFGMDDIEYFTMQVPLETPKRVKFTNEHQLIDARNAPSMTVVVLNLGTRKDRQMALFVPRDESGYTDMGVDLPPKDIWRPFLTDSVEGGIVTFFEKGPAQ